MLSPLFMFTNKHVSIHLRLMLLNCREKAGVVVVGENGIWWKVLCMKWLSLYDNLLDNIQLILCTKDVT